MGPKPVHVRNDRRLPNLKGGEDRVVKEIQEVGRPLGLKSSGKVGPQGFRGVQGLRYNGKNNLDNGSWELLNFLLAASRVSLMHPFSVLLSLSLSLSLSVSRSLSLSILFSFRPHLSFRCYGDFVFCLSLSQLEESPWWRGTIR